MLPPNKIIVTKIQPIEDLAKHIIQGLNVQELLKPRLVPLLLESGSSSMDLRVSQDEEQESLVFLTGCSNVQ